MIILVLQIYQAVESTISKTVVQNIFLQWFCGNIFFAALQVPKLLQYMNSPPTFSVLTFTLVLTYSNCIAYISMRVKKAMDECVWSLNPICNTCLLFGHGTTENTYSSTYVGDGQFSGRDRGGVIATFMRIELSYYYFCWPTKQNKYMWQSICT